MTKTSWVFTVYKTGITATVTGERFTLFYRTWADLLKAIQPLASMSVIVRAEPDVIYLPR